MTPNDHIAIAFAKIGAFLRTQQWRAAERHGLTPTQIQILLVLNARGAVRISALAPELGITQPTVSDAVAALVKKGLANRESDPDDRRAVQLNLTRAGKNLAAELDGCPPALDDALEALVEDHRSGLLRHLSLAVAGLQRSNAIPVQHMCVTCRFFRPHAHHDEAQPHHCAFVNAPFGDVQLRLECGDYEAAQEADADTAFSQFSSPPRAP